MFDFNKTPLAPPGTKVVFHSKPDQRASWAFHGVEGWYIAPAPNHYRCLTIYVPTTRSQIVSDTVKFIPRYIPIPEASIEDHLRKTTEDLVHILANKPSLIPALQPESAKGALLQIAELLHTDTTPPITSLLPTPHTPWANTQEEELCEYYINNHNTHKNITTTTPPLATSKGGLSPPLATSKGGSATPFMTSKGVPILLPTENTIGYNKQPTLMNIKKPPITMPATLFDEILEYSKNIPKVETTSRHEKPLQ